jgi:hypothetical protein
MKIRYDKDQVSVNVLRVTTIDERWYGILSKYYPSSTWVSSYGGGTAKNLLYFYGTNGTDGAEAIKRAAGNKGTKVHRAIQLYVLGQEIQMDALFPNADTGREEELTVEEYDAVRSFHDWVLEYHPKFIASEQVVLNEEVGYAGTLDLIVEIEGQKFVVDIKTSKAVYLEHEIQISSYKHALPDWQQYKTAILQVGYGANKRGWKFNVVDDKFDLFLAAYQFWKDDNPDAKPFQKDYPLSVKLPADLSPTAAAKPDEAAPTVPSPSAVKEGAAVPVEGPLFVDGPRTYETEAEGHAPPSPKTKRTKQ